MRVSEYFNLGRNQPTLDFVDIDIERDVRVYIDPNAVKGIRTVWGRKCVHYLQHFFQCVIDAIRKNDLDKAKSLLGALHEPNETHLGQSRDRSKGRAMAGGLSEDVVQALVESKAVKSGLLVNLEDSALLVEGVASDIISDIATNIIRGPLIEYTQKTCQQYGIPLTQGVASGPIWDPSTSKWVEQMVSLPLAGTNKLLLVPRSIIRKKIDFDSGEYYRHFLLTDLQEKELSANSALVKLLKNKKRVVHKKDLIAKYGNDKDAIVEITKNDPRILEKFRKEKGSTPTPAMDHPEITEVMGAPSANFEELLQRIDNIPTGHDGATDYHKAIEALFTALLYPNLAFPDIEVEIHNGRKRIDITYANQAYSGFFKWLASHYAAANIVVECKNYSSDPKNPELDQISGRFSPSRGQVGLLVCRKIDDKALFTQRCRDTAQDQRGFIIPLDDADLRELVTARINPDEAAITQFLRNRFQVLVT